MSQLPLPLAVPVIRSPDPPAPALLLKPPLPWSGIDFPSGSSTSSLVRITSGVGSWVHKVMAPPVAHTTLLWLYLVARRYSYLLLSAVIFSTLISRPGANKSQSVVGRKGISTVLISALTRAYMDHST